MNSHRIQDRQGKWHRVARSSTRAGVWVHLNKRGEPMRPWLPGQFNDKTVQVIA